MEKIPKLVPYQRSGCAPGPSACSRGNRSIDWQWAGVVVFVVCELAGIDRNRLDSSLPQDVYKPGDDNFPWPAASRLASPCSCRSVYWINHCSKYSCQSSRLLVSLLPPSRCQLLHIFFSGGGSLSTRRISLRLAVLGSGCHSNV